MWFRSNIGKTKHAEIGSHRGMTVNEHIAVGNNSYKTVKTFKCLGPSLINQNSKEEIKCRYKARDSYCYQSEHLCLLDFILII